MVLRKFITNVLPPVLLILSWFLICRSHALPVELENFSLESRKTSHVEIARNRYMQHRDSKYLCLGASAYEVDYDIPRFQFRIRIYYFVLYMPSVTCHSWSGSHLDCSSEVGLTFSNSASVIADAASAGALGSLATSTGISSRRDNIFGCGLITVAVQSSLLAAGAGRLLGADTGRSRASHCYFVVYWKEWV